VTQIFWYSFFIYRAVDMIIMDSRERVYATFRGEEVDRLAYVDFFWPETIERWESEGLPRGAFLQDYFGMDIYHFGIDISPRYEPILIERTDKFDIVRDSFGVKVKMWRGRSGTPHPVDAPVKTLEDFKELIEPLLDSELPFRISSSRYPFRGDIEQAIRKFQERFFIFGSILGPFEYARHILGESVDKILVYFYKDPEMVGYIFRTLGRFLSSIAKALVDFGVDGIWVWDDIAYKNGLFFSPRIYEKFILDAHRRITEPARAKGLPTVLHTDGNVKLLIPKIIEAGFTGLQPLEVKAGMDAIELSRMYGDRLTFIGNVDARELSKSKEEIKNEFERKAGITRKGGRYIAGSDHSVPPNVSLDNYKYFVKLIKEFRP